MAVRELPRVKTKQYTVNDVWALECDPVNEGRYFYLIDGELHEDPMPNWTHGSLALLLGHYLLLHVQPRDLGEVNVEVGYHPTDADDTVLLPDVAYVSHARLEGSFPDSYVPAMPEIAVEIKSPGNSMAQLRRKAEIYLRHGATIVWLVIPERQGVEQWQLDADGEMQHFFFDRQGALHGGTALPGFTLELSLLFPTDDNGEDHAG